MSKVRVKDISKELGISNKEMMQALRELGIQAKSHMGTLSEDEANQVRSKISQSVAQTEVIDTQVKPDVIVRRRKVSRRPAGKAEDESADIEDDSADNEVMEQMGSVNVTDSSDSDEKLDVAYEEPMEQVEPVATKVVEKPAESVVLSGPVAEPAPAVEPEASVEPQSEPEPEKKTETVQESPVEAPQEAKQDEALQTEPSQAEAVVKKEPVTDEKKDKKTSELGKSAKSKPEASKGARIIAVPTQARIVSMPKTEEPLPESPSEEKVEDAQVATKPEAPKDAQVKLEEPQEPQTPETQERESDTVKEELAKTVEPTSVADVPAQAEPVESKQDKKKKKPKRMEQAAPKVRIISMPDPAEKPAQPAKPARPAGRPQPAGGRGRPFSPGGGAPSQASGGPGGPGGAGGPAGAGAPGGSGGPGAGGDDDSRNKRKRKKDKRVVDFSSKPDSSEMPRGAQKRRRNTEVQDRTGGRRGGRKKKSRDDNQAFDQHASGTQPIKAAKRKIRMEETIRVADMAKQMGIKSQDLMKVLLGLGVMATINQSLDIETTTLAASEFGYEVEKVGFSEDDFLLPAETDKPEELLPRPPVVTIMGHVDHGKTSLLDAIRKSNVTSGEAGGITQHIGAYHVTTGRGEIVFLDTPGHEAFTAMRARGAQVTDIVILVVAADDGVMDQTREAVNHSRAANVPIVVAVNKMDKEGADPDRVKRELADLGLVPEEWGGETMYCNVSAKQHLGLDELLENVLLQAEVMELRANPAKRARGHIVEAKLDKGRGPVATVLIQEGTLKQGEAFVCGVFHGRVRAMFDDQGKKIQEAGPSLPIEVQGFDGVPEAGEEFIGVEDDKVARRIADTRMSKQRERELGKKSKVTLETLFEAKRDAEILTLNVVLKADVQGSLEAITDALVKLSGDKVRVHIAHSGAGAITETDILLASASEGIIIGFNVRPTVKVKDIAEQEGVDIRFYDIIYKLVSDIKDAMTGMLAPVIREQYLGQAEVRQTFSVPKVGIVAGLGVLDGKITRNAGVRLLRDGIVVYTGKLNSLKRFKDDVREVAKGYECGAGLENYNDIKVGDVIEAFDEVEERDTL